MRSETTYVHCDTYRCKADAIGRPAELRGRGWFLTSTQDLCPRHAPAEYECSRCGGKFVTLASFDRHLRDCKKRTH